MNLQLRLGHNPLSAAWKNSSRPKIGQFELLIESQ